MKEFKNLKFYSEDEQQILEAVSIFKKLGYRVVDGHFNIKEAKEHDGVCVWDDGEITSGWLSDDDFQQVTLEDLKEMVGEGKEVLWLNKNTLEEKYLKAGNTIRGIDWVKVPDGATFATGDKDNFVFRKDGWYYEHGEWIKTELTFDKIGNYSQLKLFWVKGDVKGGIFTLERLLGCEVLFGDTLYHVHYIYYAGTVGHLVLETETRRAYISDPNLLTFFTEDGDELTFDEYVNMYYGE